MAQTTAKSRPYSTKKRNECTICTQHTIIIPSVCAGRNEKLRQEMTPRQIIGKYNSNMKIIATLVQEQELTKYELEGAQFNIEQHIDCQELESEKWRDEQKKRNTERSDLKRRCELSKSEPAQQLHSDHTSLKQEYARVKRQLGMLRLELGRMGE